MEKSTDKEIIFVRKASGLTKEFGLRDYAMFVIAGCVASGVMFLSVSEAASMPGVNMSLSFLYAALLLVPASVTVALMTSAMPRSGGMYVCISRIIGPTVGVFSSWLVFIGEGLGIGLLGAWASTILGGAFTLVGYITGANSLTALGVYMGSTLGSTIVGFLLTLLFWGVLLYGARVMKIVIYFLMAFALIGTALAVGTFVALGPTGLMSGFDATWGAGAAEKIISAAAQAGWTTPAFSQQSTLAGMFVALFAYIGFEAMNYASGEVRDPSKSIIKGMAIGFTLVTALYVFITWAAYYAGGTLLPAYDFLFDNHQSTLAAIMPVVTPSIPLFAGSAIGRALPWVAAILTFTIALWFVKAILITFFIPSRLLFALSFDRSLSPKLSKVSRRGAPTAAIHISGICALVGVVMWYFGGIATTVLGILDFMLLQIFFFFGLAATLFPYIRRDLYMSVPRQYEVSGVPLVSIFGVLTVATAFFIFIFTLQSLNYASITMLIVISVIGLILYAHQQSQNLKEGIDINRIYTQIPPE